MSHCFINCWEEIHIYYLGYLWGPSLGLPFRLSIYLSIMSRFGWSFTQKALGRTFMKTRPPTRLWKFCAFWVTYMLKKAVHIAVKMSNEMEVSKVEKFQSQNTQLWIASLIEYGSVCLQFAKVATDEQQVNYLNLNGDFFASHASLTSATNNS